MKLIKKTRILDTKKFNYIDSTRFFGIFVEGRLAFSSMNGMAFLFDSKNEASQQAKHLKKSLPKHEYDVKEVLLVEESE